MTTLEQYLKDNNIDTAKELHISASSKHYSEIDIDLKYPIYAAYENAINNGWKEGNGIIKQNDGNYNQCFLTWILDNKFIKQVCLCSDSIELDKEYIINSLIIKSFEMNIPIDLINNFKYDFAADGNIVIYIN